jgi:hypothetical protein
MQMENWESYLITFWLQFTNCTFFCSNPEVYSKQHYVIVCQGLATGRWFSPGPPVPFTNKIDSHDIAEILLKVVLDTIKPKPNLYIFFVLEYQHFASSLCRGCTRVFSQLIRYSTVWPGWSNGHVGADNDPHIFWSPSWMCSLMRHFSSHWLVLSYAYKITLQYCHQGVSEWLLITVKSAIFLLYRGENKLIFNGMVTMSSLY